MSWPHPESTIEQRLLSLHPGREIDVTVAATLAGIEPDEAEDCLEALFDCNLLKRHKTDRFHFHYLIRDCAAQLLAETTDTGERTAALRRLFIHHLQVARTLCSPFHNSIHDVPELSSPLPAPASRAEAIERLDAEHDNLVSVAQLAVGSRWPPAWQLLATLYPYLKLRHFDGASYELFKAGAEVAKADGNPLGESTCLRALAAVCRHRRLTDEATRHLGRSLALTRELGDKKAEAAYARAHLAVLGTGGCFRCRTHGISGHAG